MTTSVWCEKGGACDGAPPFLVGTAVVALLEAVESVGVASTAGYHSDDVQSVMLESVEQRIGLGVPSATIEWLSDSGSVYTADATRQFARGLGLPP